MIRKPDFTRGEEAKRLLLIAAPLMAAYIAEFSMFLTTKLVVGSLGYKHLAAVGLGGSLSFEALVVTMGLLSITGVLAAQAEGAGRKAEAGHAARQGLIVAALLSIPLGALVWNLDAVMRWTGQDAEVAALAKPYLHVLSFFALPTLLFTVLRDFVAALSRTGPVMAITVAAVLVNWTLAEGLVHGRWFLPEMGIAGAGAAKVIVAWAMLAALTLYIWRKPALRGYGLFRARLRFDPAIVKVIFRLGLPIAGLVGVEAGLFSAVGLLSGIIGAEMLAAHQVLMGWIGIPFVIALGLAEAAMVRVAHGVGRGDPAGARQAGLVALGIGVAILTLMVAAPLLLAETITRIFISADDPGFEAVSGIVSQLMVIAAIFQVFDGAQAIMSRALRGVRDAYYPLWLGAFGYWALGVGGGWFLAFPMGLGGVGLWVGLAVGLIVTACLLTLRFLAITGRAAKVSSRAPAI
ncbi:MATE family efflux transporter [Pikeienuella piscinae]|uniref:MATE family efflux transporter n=1 Tax=Pikeienuella piscinae TaxID=2748098 RepID=A0A7L5BYW7_9RHOB|nr:MATE family efflux transporter [Pikeienuella piscinae]QIE56932.1 MATE family efflux transporter [Pikeienuella piscinae]